MISSAVYRIIWTILGGASRSKWNIVCAATTACTAGFSIAVFLSWTTTGHFAGFIGSCVDVDERRRAQDAEQQHSQQQLALAHDFEKWILTIVSHDIRDPLGTILFAARRLQDVADAGSAAKKHAEMVERGVHRIQHIVGDLLDLAREREGEGIPIEPRPADLRNLCRQIVDELEAKARDRQITFECDVDGVGEWDEHRIVQALSNLASNAVQHGTPGSPIRIRVTGNAEQVSSTCITAAPSRKRCCRGCLSLSARAVSTRVAAGDLVSGCSSPERSRGRTAAASRSIPRMTRRRFSSCYRVTPPGPPHQPEAAVAKWRPRQPSGERGHQPVVALGIPGERTDVRPLPSVAVRLIESSQRASFRLWALLRLGFAALIVPAYVDNIKRSDTIPPTIGFRAPVNR